MAGESGWRASVGDQVRRDADGEKGPVNKIVALTFDGLHALVEVSAGGVRVRAWQPVKTLRPVAWDEELGIIG